MKKTLQTMALIVALAGISVWVGKGGHRGWTRTSMQVKTVDEVTGLEGIDYRKHFLPGLDFLGGTLLGAGALAVASAFFRKTKSQQSEN